MKCLLVALVAAFFGGNVTGALADPHGNGNIVNYGQCHQDGNPPPPGQSGQGPLTIVLTGNGMNVSYPSSFDGAMGCAH